MKRPKRIQISKKTVDKIILDFRKKLKKAIRKHGFGACWSNAEIIGMLTEEYDEAKREVHKNKTKGLRSELLDVMIASLWGVASIDVGTANATWDDHHKAKKRKK